MRERSWTFIDKAAYGPGPWADEPDKLQWPDAATGLPCLIVRNALTGNWCGYVGVPPGHPAYRQPYGDVPADAHGGLSFSDTCQPDNAEHGICHVVEPGEPDDVWWIGFDCAHAFDVMPGLEVRIRAAERRLAVPLPHGFPEDTYKDVAYVRAECANLAGQLAGMFGR
jgi:hypothetical protein